MQLAQLYQSCSSIQFKLMLASNKEQFARQMIAWELEANNSAQERLFIMPHCKGLSVDAADLRLGR